MSLSASGQVETKTTERPDGLVATVTIRNERRLNTLNAALMADFIEALAGLSRNDALRLVVIAGAGEKAFSGGADITEMAALSDAVAARAFIRRVHACCAAVRDCPVPTIARIQGFALGGAFELVISCDLRIASTRAIFGLPEVRLGIPSVVEAALLPGIVGWGRARQIILAGENFSAAEAHAWNLIEELAEPDRLDDAVETWVSRLLRAKPKALRAQKALLRAWEDMSPRAAIATSIETFGAAFETDEPRIAMREFLAAREGKKAKPARS